MLRIVLIILSVPFIAFPQYGPIPGIDSTSDFLVYYGNWTNELIARAEPFDLVILDASNLTYQMVQDLRDGADDIPGTADDVIVLCYVSIGEVASGNIVGNGLGPCQFQNGQVTYDSAGYASWYVDDADNNNLPDQNGVWGSYYVNAGDTLWWEYIRSMPGGIDEIMTVLQCDGLFFDTIDTASPWTPYYWTVEGMSNLIAAIRSWYPNAILMANRGLFYFDPALQAYNYTIRPYINAVLFEDYYTEWNWNQGIGVVSPYFQNNKQYWAPRVNNEAHQPDGFTVFALDYLNPQQSNYQTMLQNQIHEVIELQGWVDAISSIYLDEIRYDVYHHHTPDINYPTWPDHLGIGAVLMNGQRALIRWDAAFDQTPPLHYNIYYTTQLPFNFSTATKLAHVAAESSASSFDFEYLVDNLQPSTEYYFAVRAEDSATPPHEDQNNFYLSGTTMADPSTVHIQIDGNFSDWTNVPLLDFPPFPFENTGDGPTIDTDIVDAWAWATADTLFLSFRVQRYISQSSNFYRILLDTDRLATTGFRWDNSRGGFDFMIENAQLYRYNGQNNSWDWNYVAPVSHQMVPSRMEMALPVSALNFNSPDWAIDLIFQCDNGTAFPGDLAPDTYQQESYSIGTVTTGLRFAPTEEGVQNSELKVEVYPNPSNASFTLYLVASKPYPHVQIRLFNLLGQAVREIYQGALPAGTVRIQVDAQTRTVSSGVYLLSVQAGKERQIRKLLLVN